MKARYAEIAAGTAVGIDGGRYYLYEDDMLGKVADNFRRLGVPVDEHHRAAADRYFEQVDRDAYSFDSSAGHLLVTRLR